MEKYIDREKLLAEFDGPGGRTVYGKFVPAIVSRINLQPAADVAPVVHGVWLESISLEPEFGGGFMPRRTYFCSECGLREKRKWPYCHCGAKMDGGMEDV